MGPDCYKIEVLHYLNPHLIWVEVTDPSVTKKDEFLFEQIGIYGILPLETTINIDEQALVTQRCDNWLPASSVTMKKALLEAEDVYFRPTYIDRRSTVLDDNIHKYGEIIVTRPSGKQKHLSKALAKSGFAFYDECLFHQQLHSGKLKTKLSNDKIEDVIKQLEQHSVKKPNEQWRKSVKKQTSVFQTAHKLESMLTEQNLQAHNRKSEKTSKIDTLLQQKMKDFNMCKGVDEESIGRASRKENAKLETESSLLKKMLKFKQAGRKIQSTPSQSPADILTATKRFLEDNSVIKKSQIPDNTEEAQTHDNANNNETKVSKQHNAVVTEVNKAVATEVTGKNSSESYDSHVDQQLPRRRHKANKHTKNKPQDYDVNTQILVAYGPPSVDRTKLRTKIVSKEYFEEINAVPDEIERLETPTKVDDFGNIDSDVEMESNEFNSKDAHSSSNNAPEEFETKTNQNTANTYTSVKSTSSSWLQMKLQHYKDNLLRKHDSSGTSVSNTSNKDSSISVEEHKPKKTLMKKRDLDSDDESVSEIVEKLNLEYAASSKSHEEKRSVLCNQSKSNYVNPFKNVDANISVFVDKLITPVLMVHSKNNTCFKPSFELRNVNFNTHIRMVLKSMSIERPMMVQTISWYTILRGHSLFMISPKGSGKTMGYLPAVCRSVTDNDSGIKSKGPICIIVCATSLSVFAVEKLAKNFVGHKQKVLAIYTGMKQLDMTTALLNGCEMLICTPCILVGLLQSSDYGVDMHRLTTFVLDDCERLAEVYGTEIKLFHLKIKEMLKNRVKKELKVQHILASRVWCDFMTPLAKKVPDTVICIGAFQECVLYSKASTTATFVTEDQKIPSVLDFLQQIDKSKKTVIVCRSDSEVDMLENILNKSNYVVFACNNSMTINELYNLSLSWTDYKEPIIGPILVCCDGNLIHLNITDAHHLVHYSLPQLFSTFCKRFSVLNDNYSSIFKENDGNVKIKILLEDSNVEQLPKIMHFIKRCTHEVPKVLDEVCEKVLSEKDILKAVNLVPVCDNLLALGECPDFWNCQERHSLLKSDEPKDWVPKTGMITFKIIHYHTAVSYSARLLSNVTQQETIKYPQTHKVLSTKIAMYFSKESNKKLHGEPKVGDICATSIRQNFFVRCQVVKILKYYQNGAANCVLIKLIDEERLEKSRDIYLYHLPDDMKDVETHVVHVRLANIQPKDKDITFSELAKQELCSITDKDEELYMGADVVLTIGNCVVVDNLVTCRDLTSTNKTVVRHDFKQELLGIFAIPNPEHIPKLQKLCEGKISIAAVTPKVEVAKPVKELPEIRWAHLETDLSLIFCASAADPDTFFVRLVKFSDCINILVKDIQNYVAELTDTEKVTNITEGEIVIAKFPDDDVYERARIDDVIDGPGGKKVKCFFVDQGDWRYVSVENIVPIVDKFITQIPFQAIECRMIGIKPQGENWSDFSANWFTNHLEDAIDNFKQLYVKYFVKETAKHTGGHKYGVALLDTNTDHDVLINQLMIDLKLARPHEDEISYFEELDFEQTNKPLESQSDDDDADDDWEKVPKHIANNDIIQSVPLQNVFPKKPIRSVPLVASDSDNDEDRWNFNISEDFLDMFKPMQKLKSNFPALKSIESTTSDDNALKSIDSQSDTSSNCLKDCSMSDSQELSSVKVLDSDDFTSPEPTQVSLKLEKPKVEISEDRKPMVYWSQNKATVTVKIKLIGVNEYNLEITDDYLKFDTNANDTHYAFNIELYGIVDSKNCSHSNKGQYILIKLAKILTKNWLSLSRNVKSNRSWIKYDVDTVDTSSSEEEIVDDTINIIKGIHESQECMSEEEDDIVDDVNFNYKRDCY